MNLTVTIDDEILKRARIRALEQGTSVNALLRDYLESFAGVEQERLARKRLVELADASTASSGPSGRTWKRDELYEDRIERLSVNDS